MKDIKEEGTDTFLCCMMCGYRTADDVTFKNHVYSTHSPGKNFDIEYFMTFCEKYFDTVEDPVENIDFIHDKFTGICECLKCNKIYNNKTYLIKHVCRPNYNKLECPKCQALFTCESSRCRHVQNCKGLKPKEFIPMQFTGLDRAIPFVAGHMSLDSIVKCKSRRGPANTALNIYRLLLKNPRNICVRKHSLGEPYSYIHVGKGVWEKKPDCNIYIFIVYAIMEYFDILVEELLNMFDKQKNSTVEKKPYPLVRLQQFKENVNSNSNSRDFICLTHVIKSFHVDLYKSSVV